MGTGEPMLLNYIRFLPQTKKISRFMLNHRKMLYTQNALHACHWFSSVVLQEISGEPCKNGNTSHNMAQSSSVPSQVRFLELNYGYPLYCQLLSASGFNDWLLQQKLSAVHLTFLVLKIATVPCNNIYTLFLMI